MLILENHSFNIGSKGAAVKVAASEILSSVLKLIFNNSFILNFGFFITDERKSSKMCSLGRL